MNRDDFAIDFELRPVSEIQPWGRMLHWFGLTDGWNDVLIGGQRLYSGPGETRGIDYQVVRLWEDLIEVAPYALENVPEPLASRLADLWGWNAWVAKALDLDEHDEIVDCARLVVPPRDVGESLRPCRRCRCGVGDDLHLQWHAQDGSETWASPNGRATITESSFREELTRFDRELIAAMESRVRAIESGWKRPDIGIDVEALRGEHAERALSLPRALELPRFREPAWNDIPRRRARSGQAHRERHANGACADDGPHEFGDIRGTVRTDAMSVAIDTR